MQCYDFYYSFIYIAAQINKESFINYRLANLIHSNFRNQSEPGMKTESALPLEPRQMSVENSLLYKWVLPSMKGLRSTVEKMLGQALDWSDENERNSLIYESCEALARLHSPFVKLDDSFVLQEFFVPMEAFTLWMKQSKSILIEYGKGRHSNVTLLNLTIRFVKQDSTTFLAYSRSKNGSYAFVLYYRIKRNQEADDTLKEIHNSLADITLSLGTVI